MRMPNRSPVRALALAAVLAGCSADRLSAPIETAVTPAGSAANPSAALQSLAAGIVVQDRASQLAYVLGVGLLGREAYNLTPQEGRNTTGFFRDYADNTSFGGGSNFTGRLVNLRNIFGFRQAVAASAATLGTAGVAAADGFASTEEAIQVYHLVATRFDLGTPVRVDSAVDAVTPFVSRDSAYRFVSGRLDAGFASLQQGGSAFPFNLPTGGSGFTGFTTPATYARFNRALKAANEVERGSLGCGTACYQAALTALGQSFITADLTAANLNTGVYYPFSASTGDALNSLFTNRNDIYASQTIVTDASVPQNDLRVTSKLLTGQTSRSVAGSDASTTRFARYTANDTPLPLIDNEELWLIRAEALWFTGDRAGATAALNAVARVAGGQVGNRYTQAATDADFVTQLLAERRLSLLLEGHRWVDVRRFGRLSTLPAGGTGFTVATQLPVPQAECQARDRIVATTGTEALRGPGCPLPAGTTR